MNREQIFLGPKRCLWVLLNRKRMLRGLCLEIKMLLALFFIFFEVYISVSQNTVPTDIVLLVDSSDTMEPSSLPYVKKFLIRMIDSLPIGPNKYRLALAQYSDELYTEFMLDTYRRKGPMVNHIRNYFTLKGGGSVQTGDALNEAYETFFQKSADEKEKQNIIVILTSAPSEDDVQETARSLQSLGVKIIAIGTKEASYNELFEMATPPFYYKNPVIEELPKFSEYIPQIINDIIQENISDLMEISTLDFSDIAVQEDTTDIVLLIPGQQDTENYAFPYIKDFISKLIYNLPLESNQYRIALVQYNDDVHEEFELDTYISKEQMSMHVQEMQTLQGGPLNTGNALHYVYERYFQEPVNGGDRNQVLVVLSSSPSEDDVEEPVKMLQDNGVKVIALGIYEAAIQQLNLMATQSFSYFFPNEWDLPMFSTNVSNIIAEFQMESIKEAEVCDGDLVADVVFTVDHGTSKSNFEELKKFLQNLTSSFDVKESCIRIGLVMYTEGQEVVSRLNTNTSKAEILQIIQDLSAGSGKANTGAAINATRLKLFTESAGSRKKQGVEQIAVLVTHRHSQDNVSDVATHLRRSGVTVFAIGVEDASDPQLDQIASYPQEQYVTSLKEFSDLQRQNTVFQKKLLNQIQNKLYVQSERNMILKTGCQDTEAADIYFLVDGSSSLDYLDFMDMKNFLKEMIKLFDIGMNKVRLGVVQFSHFNELEFELDKYTSASDLIKGIENIRQIYGNTSTGGALAYMKPLFEKARRQRGVTVPCHLIVLTDGESHDSVKEPAMKLREDQINIYAVGVREANVTQLYEIAGVKKRVYFVHDFDLLDDIKNEVTREICTTEVCKEMKGDIMFLVDSSGSIGDENFLKMKNFMRELVNRTDVGADRVQIGVVQFSHEPKEEFKLNTYITKRDIFSAIDRISPLQSTTLTGEALKFMLKYFQASSGSRHVVKKVLILITDGESQDDVKGPATMLRDKGIIIYSVGVFNANKTQLEEISGKRDMVFYVENFDILNQIISNLIFDICSRTPDDKCRRVECLDIVFVMDSSGSISSSQYQAMKDFMIALVKQSNVSPDGVQFGALKYSDKPVVLFYLNKYVTKLEITEAIQKDDPIGQTTYTAEALVHSEMFFTEERGSRKNKGVPQVLIVITDGESHDKDKLDTVSQRLRNKGITIYAVGVEGAKRNELLTMAGSEDKCFYVDTFEGLENLTANITNDICDISEPACPAKADVFFLVDGSKNIDEENFRIMMDFVRSVINPAVNVQHTKIGLALYGRVYKEEFQLGIFSNRSELELKIKSIKPIKGYQSDITNALEKVKVNFQPEKGSRIHENIQQILLVISTGRTTSRAARAAEDLRKKGVDIYAIGVGNVDQSQLTQITGSSSRKYAVDDFSNLKTIKKRLVDVICEDNNRKAACFVDITVGFDISSQREGHHLFYGQTELERRFPDILQALLSLRDVSCNVGSKAQSSVAVHVKNTVTPISAKFYIDKESVLRNLSDAVIKRPSQLTVDFLQSLWETFQNKDKTQQKVLLVFSDGVDDDLEALEQKSEELKKKGLDGLITVVLEGASNFQNLQSIEFGKGFDYRTRLDIGMTDIASRLSKFLNNIAERTCCCLSCKCTGDEGEIGDRGKRGIKGPNGVKGNPGYPGDEGEPGPRGPPGLRGKQGNVGCPGKRGLKGFRGFVGKKGDNGEDGVDGIRGEEGLPGVRGKKGEKGDTGYLGSPGPRGPSGDRGQKGFRGDPGSPGLNSGIAGAKGFAGEMGQEGERGEKGSRGSSGGIGNPGIPGQRGQRGSEGNRGQPGQNGMEGKQGYKGPQGQKGINGQKGQKGRSGPKGPPNEPGAVGLAGAPGAPGKTGIKGQPGEPGPKGERGPYGLRGRRGEDGAFGYGPPGEKGVKGNKGFPGDLGQKGEAGDKGITGENGLKGYRGRMGVPGPAGLKGSPGDGGFPGRRGSKGPNGQALFSPCELIDYVRKHSSCWDGKLKCPLYPTELVFALDSSRTLTPETFELMREIMIAIVSDARIRDSNCPVGARVAVVSYNSVTHHVIRFSEFHNKNKLLNALKNISYQTSSSERDTGGAMRFIVKNVFKRTLQGPNVRKIAVVFSLGPATDASSVKQAVLEMRAVEVVPVVIAFENTPHISQAFLMDDSGLFQVLNVHGRQYNEVLRRFQLCTLCYDKCKPDAFCERPRPRSVRAYVDAAFILDSSQKLSGAEFEQVKDFMGRAVTAFNISSDPETSVVGDRIAVVSHALPDFKAGTGKSPVKKEFDFVTYRSQDRMRRYIKESLQQLNGEAAVSYAIQWTIGNIFSGAPNPRPLKFIIIISAGKTSQWDKKMLKNISLQAKCQGYALLVISLGKSYDRNELEELASTPLEQHLIQLGRIHKPELDYVMRFLKPFIRFLRSENNYPPEELKGNCSGLHFQSQRRLSSHS
ncbi:collagen alpha-6(VI) chain isoform A [Patagioenas fasciata monilis]|uniref:Collagen alpha-6(VI) chain isoform A n=1 Tax=Patagioenas fasciata monilis TaxID=372326 RepID=A0A1V4KCD9_PATFA|nr:collagen alpha-6(VI) chain isoform A [Patagioenas fasciata monilis]